MKSGRKKKDVPDETMRFRELVRALPDDFFDGHTEFRALNPEQKLALLSACARFVYEAQQKKPSGRRKLPGS
jgi:hypothetical protein